MVHTVPTRPTDSDAQRARVVVVALAVLVAMIVATALVASVIDDGKPADPPVTAEGEELYSSPAIIPKPNSGEAPDEAGDRGGWAQLALLGMIVLALGGIGFAVARGSRRSRANRAEWLAAADSDSDGVIDDRRT